MRVAQARVLCAGPPSNLMELRCEILTRSGYHAQSASFAEALELLRAEHFDLVILSEEMIAADRDSLLSAIGNETVTLVLESLISPVDLLDRVEKLLQG